VEALSALIHKQAAEVKELVVVAKKACGQRAERSTRSSRNLAHDKKVSLVTNYLSFQIELIVSLQHCWPVKIVVEPPEDTSVPLNTCTRARTVLTAVVCRGQMTSGPGRMGRDSQAQRMT
jgi:hypothetical protein